MDKLFQEGHHAGFLSDDSDCDLIVRVARDCALGEKLHDFRIGDPLVVLRIDCLEKLLDLSVNVLVEREDTTLACSVHISDQVFEGLLIDDA